MSMVQFLFRKPKRKVIKFYLSKDEAFDPNSSVDSTPQLSPASRSLSECYIAIPNSDKSYNLKDLTRKYEKSPNSSNSSRKSKDVLGKSELSRSLQNVTQNQNGLLMVENEKKTAGPHSEQVQRKLKKSSLLRRITKEMKKIVHEARKDTSSYDPGREAALLALHRHIKAKNRILDSYSRVKNALKELQDKYVNSKDNKNVFSRYSQLKKMIREVTIFEKQYWTLIDLPKQGLNDTPTDYVNSILNSLDDRIQDQTTSPAKGSGGLSSLMGPSAQLAQQAREASQLEKHKNKSSDELKKEILKEQDEICKLVRKYLRLKSLVAQLHNEFEATKTYPIVPRYSLLKDMIKSVLRAPFFTEVCHEVDD